jgi:dGTPase
MSLDWRQCMSTQRFGAPAEDSGIARTAFQRDHDRVLFSGAFRRLADKTQVFPLPYDDHVHSRLTHSLEVASIGRSLGTLVGARVLEREPSLAPALEARDFGDCVSAACLAHDLGNPPFGHVGEDAIQEFFKVNGGLLETLSGREQIDMLRFEGNAQAYRMVTRTERRSRGGGLRLAHATLGALVKYPCSSVASDGSSKVKRLRKPGLFSNDVAEFEKVAASLGLWSTGPDQWVRHPLAYITEAADDITYLLLDLEDGFRLGLVPIEEYAKSLEPLCEQPDDRDPRSLTYEDRLDWADQRRSIAMSTLIRDAAESFMRIHDSIMEGRFTGSLKSVMSSESALQSIEHLCIKKCYQARDVLKMELAGTEAIQGLLSLIVAAQESPDTLRGKHMKALYPRLFQDAPAYERLQRLTDHVSGMTDHYAVRLYRELRGMRYPGGRD